MALHEEALLLQRQLDRKDILAAFPNSLGNAVMHQGHYERAATLVTESLALCRELDNAWGRAIALRNLGLVARFQGDYDCAAMLFEESLALSQQTGSVQSLEGLARAHARDGRGTLEQAECAYAARLFGTAEALRGATGAPFPPAAWPAYQHAVSAVCERLGSQASAAQEAMGAAMPLDELVNYALSQSSLYEQVDPARL